MTGAVRPAILATARFVFDVC